MPVMLSSQTWWRRSWSASWTSWTKRTDYLNPATSTSQTLFTTNTRTTSASLWVTLQHEEEVVPLQFTRENRDKLSEQLENRTLLSVQPQNDERREELIKNVDIFLWIIFSYYHSLTTIGLINEQHRGVCHLFLPLVSSLRTHAGRQTAGSTERSTSTFQVFI